MTEDATSARDITDGFPDDAFAELSDAQRDQVSYLLARASERAYRRGFQQGYTIGRDRPGDVRADLHQWRYGITADDSPWADSPRIETATGRLFLENHGLRRLGFREPIGDCFVGENRRDLTYRSRDGVVRGLRSRDD